MCMQCFTCQSKAARMACMHHIEVEKADLANGSYVNSFWHMLWYLRADELCPPLFLVDCPDTLFPYADI